MKGIFIATIFLFVSYSAYSQNAKAPNVRLDSLNSLPETSTNNSAKFNCLQTLVYDYLWIYPDSALPYIQQQISLAKKMKSDSRLFEAYTNYAWFNRTIGDYPKAALITYQILQLAEKSGNYI